MATTKTVWAGGSTTVSLANLKNGVVGNSGAAESTFAGASANINAYKFNAVTGLTKGTPSGNSCAYTASSAVNKSKTYDITGYLEYKHNAPGTSTKAVSNTTSAGTLTVKQPFNTTSVTSLGVSPSSVWSNETAAKTITLNTNLSTTYAPYSNEHTITSDSTTNANNKGSAPNLAAATSTSQTVSWTPSTSSDLGATSRDITFTVNSTTTSAASVAGICSGKLTVKNAVTALAAGNLTIYQSSTKGNTVAASFTPTAPYSKEVILVGETSDTAPSANNGCSVSLSGQTVTLNCSAPTTKSTTTTFKFRIKSVQKAGDAVYSPVYTLTATGVSALTGKNVVEGATISVAGGIGAITKVTVNSGGVTASVNASDNTKIDIKGPGVSANTNYSVTIENAQGATNTISGTVTNITAKTVYINTGDITTAAMGVGAISDTPTTTDDTVATATVNSTDNTKIDVVTYQKAGTATISVTGTNGATNTLTVNVQNVSINLA